MRAIESVIDARRIEPPAERFYAFCRVVFSIEA